MSHNDMIVEILKIVNDLREEIRDIRKESDKKWKQYEENRAKDKEENDKKWKQYEEDRAKDKEENDRRWKQYEENRAKDKEENDRKWKQYEKNRVRDRKDILGILTSYEMTISEQLGDPNVEKMRKLV